MNIEERIKRIEKTFKIMEYFLFVMWVVVGASMVVAGQWVALVWFFLAVFFYFENRDLQKRLRTERNNHIKTINASIDGLKKIKDLVKEKK